MSTTAVNHSALMIEGSRDDLSLKLTDTWSSGKIGAKQKSTEHIMLAARDPPVSILSTIALLGAFRVQLFIAELV